MPTASYEVEQKFLVVDLQQVIDQLTARDIEVSDAERQLDTYYAHPSRDFASTDEALRIRQVGASAWLTYKGPRIDAETKTRQELDVPLGPGSHESFDQLLQFLGFQPVGSVSKNRRTAEIQSHGWTVVIALDEVDSLGFFVELEIIAEQEQLPVALQILSELSSEFQLNQAERTSYLELLQRSN